MVGFNGRVVVATMLLIVVVATAVYLIGQLFRLRPEEVGVFAQGAFRSNTVFYGLPVCIMAFGDGIIAPTAIFLAATLIVYNFASVIVLIAPHRQQDGKVMNLARFTRELFINPIILGCAAGLLYGWLRWPLHPIAEKVCVLVGGLALPLALIELGSGIRLKYLRGIAGLASANAFIKLLVVPLATYLLLSLLGPVEVQAKVAVIMMAMPTAMMSYIYARQLQGSESLAAQQLILSTLLSILTIPLWLFFLGID
jgi:predicted permease